MMCFADSVNQRGSGCAKSGDSYWSQKNGCIAKPPIYLDDDFRNFGTFGV